MDDPHKRWHSHLDSRTELPTEQATALQDVVLSAVTRYLNRKRFRDRRRLMPLKDWDYLWDALAWSDSLRTKESLMRWLIRTGECWLLDDRFRGRAWRIHPEQGRQLRGEDVYLIPVRNPTCCYVSTHEVGLGPWCTPFTPDEVEYLTLAMNP